MKHFKIIFLLIIFTGCKIKPNDCKCTNQNFLSGDSLESWENMTAKAMVNSKNAKLVFLSNSWNRDRVDLFYRKAFLNDIYLVLKNDSSKFGELRVLEFTKTAEKIVTNKYLFLTCGDVTHMKIFRKENENWTLFKASKLKAKAVNNLFAVLKNHHDKTVFFGNRINDFLVISEIINNTIKQVYAYPSLNKAQYEALSELTK